MSYKSSKHFTGKKHYADDGKGIKRKNDRIRSMSIFGGAIPISRTSPDPDAFHL